VSLRQQAARGVFWSAAGNWGYQLTTLVVVVMLSRLLTPEAFGLVALASVFTALMKLLTEQGLADALVQRRELDPEHLDTAFWMSASVGVLMSAGLVASSWLIADLVNQPDLALVIVWLAPILTFAGLSSVQRAVLTRDLRFASLTLRKLSSVFAGAIVGVTAALAGFGVWSLVAQLLTIEFVGLVALWTASDWRPHLRFSRRHLRDLFGFGASVVGFRLLRFLNTRIDNLVVGAVLGATALGFYVVAYRLLELVISVTTAIIGTVAFPVISRIQHDLAKVQNAYYKAMRLTSAIAFPAFIGLIVVAPEITRLTFGPQWDASVPVMQVLALAGLLNSILFINGIVMKSLGKPSWRLIIMALTTIVLVIAFAVVVHRGIVAVATAFAIVSFAFAPLWLLGTHKLIVLDARRYVRQMGPPLISASMMAASLVGLKPLIDDIGLFWEVALLVTAGAATYSVALWFVGRPLAKEALALVRLAIPRRAAGAQ
jgi:O-antigen/teichoic acid export membrane protein